MITVRINKPWFEYDIHGLVRAFYPGQEVKIVCEEKEAQVQTAYEPRASKAEGLTAEEVSAQVQTAYKPRVSKAEGLIAEEVSAQVQAAYEPRASKAEGLIAEEVSAQVQTAYEPRAPKVEGLTAEELSAQVQSAYESRAPKAQNPSAEELSAVRKGRTEQAECQKKEPDNLQHPIWLDIQYGHDSIIMNLGILYPGGSSFRISEAKHNKDASQKQKKDLLKQLIYQGLSKHLDMELPWGTLTGIRPTKIPMAMLEEGKDEEEILRHMRENYFISEEKGRLGIGIAKREKELLSGLHYQDGYSLYIGIPFCPTTCLYCSFTSYPVSVWKKRVRDYLEALEKEMAAVAKLCREKVLDTVYIGGGTPTTLEPEELDFLLTALEKHFDVNQLQEFTVEAGRADSITKEKLRVLKQHKVGRISVNPQTMKEETLKLIGRRHTVEQVREAFVLAREEGFDNINMDIILGLPGEDEEDVRNTVAQLKALGPDSLTVHSLAVKRASGMGQWIEENGMEALKNTATTMAIADKAAEQMGMQPYYLYRQKNMSGNLENVGYAKPGKYGIYNILIMEEKQMIAALGAGGISKLILPEGRIERSENVKDVGLYIQRIEEMLERKEKLFRCSALIKKIEFGKGRH